MAGPKPIKLEDATAEIYAAALARAEFLRQLSIFERLDLAAAEVGQLTFKKNKTVWLREPGTKYKDDPGKGYSILPIDQILDPIRRIHGRYGIKLFISPPEYDHDQHESVKAETIRNQPGLHARGRCHYILYGRDREDCIEGEVPIESADTADKLNNKLITNAERTLYRVLYAIDGDDAQDPEEINGVVPEEPNGGSKENPRDDRFFRPLHEKIIEKITQDEKQKEKQTEDDIPPAEAPAVTEITLERPREVKEDTINKACKDANLRLVVMKYAKQKEYGYNTETWTDDQINTVYAAVVEAGRL